MDNTATPFLATLRLPVKPALYLRRIVLFTHAICLILAWLNGLPIIYKIILTSVIVVSFYHYFEKSALYKGMSEIDSLILGTKDNWLLKMQDGSTHPATLGNSLFVHPWITIISLRFCHRREYFIFTPDNIDADAFRRLRVRLRFKVGE